MNAEEIWREKTDDEVLEAYRQLGDYTDEGQCILRAEVERRQLSLAPPAFDPSGQASDEGEEPRRHPLARLWTGGYSLPQTYWGWAFGGGFAWRVLWALLDVVGASGGTGYALLIWLFFFAQIAYTIVVLVAVWRSANRYRGKPVWATLAKVAVAVTIAVFVGGLLGFGPR